MRLRLPFRLSYLLVPGLMLLVAAVQMTLVRTHDLTPWKGGGFGMFSTFDSPSARTLRVVVETEAGEALVMSPYLTDKLTRIVNLPDDATLRRVAARAAGGQWRVYEHDDILRMKRILPDRHRRQVSRAEAAIAEADSTGAPAPRLDPIAFPERKRPLEFEGRALGARAARAEVWRVSYDPETRSMSASLLNSVTVRKP